MTYDIEPREVAGVILRTGAERDELTAVLRRMPPLVDDATAAARPAAAVAAELDRFRADHETAARDIAARLDSALTHGELAVDAYVRGDAEMAGQYGRAAVVFDQPLVPFPPLSPGAVAALPARVRG